MSYKFGELHVATLNGTYMQIGADDSILRELSDFFSFEVPGAQFMPKVKYGLWDGRKRLFNYVNQTLYVGLYAHLVIFARERNYKIIAYEDIIPVKDIKYDDYTKFIESLNIHSDGDKIQPYYFQETAILHGMTNERATIVSPTSSGKSLIIYALSEHKRRQGNKILIVVPTVSLVVQLFEDFKDYSSEIDWDVKEHCHKIYSGQEKDSDKPIIISTWQSLQKKPGKYFHKFDVCIFDEVHGAKSDEMVKILENCVNAHTRYGLTGTLQDTQVHKLVIVGLLGPDKKIIGTKQLMDEGYIAKLSIKVLMLKYSTEERKKFRKLILAAKKKSKQGAYAAEMEYIVSSEARMRQLIALTKAVKGNTLILFQYVDRHGKIIYKRLLEESGKKVYYISGETGPEERERIRQLMEVENDVVLIASFGTFSTGVSVKNILNVIFAAPSKSKIKVLQSIGRGLRISKVKDSVTLYDIVDDLTYQAKKNAYPNYVMKHFWERWKIYKEEKFRVRIFERGI